MGLKTPKDPYKPDYMYPIAFQPNPKTPTGFHESIHCDTKLNKETGYEQAAINAQMNPFFEMKVEKQFSDYTFRRMMTNYVDHLNLEFIKTTQEIKKQCKNTSIYSR